MTQTIRNPEGISLYTYYRLRFSLRAATDARTHLRNRTVCIVHDYHQCVYMSDCGGWVGGWWWGHNYSIWIHHIRWKMDYTISTNCTFTTYRYHVRTHARAHTRARLHTCIYIINIYIDYLAYTKGEEKRGGRGGGGGGGEREWMIEKCPGDYGLYNYYGIAIPMQCTLK